MAERIVRQLIDDIDGSEIREGSGESIQFSLRGVTYRIDLSSTNAAKLDKALKPYIEAAVKVATARRGRTKSSRTGSASREQLAVIREWARKRGYEVADRGRIRADLVDAFEAAH